MTRRLAVAHAEEIGPEMLVDTQLHPERPLHLDRGILEPHTLSV